MKALVFVLTFGLASAALAVEEEKKATESFDVSQEEIQLLNEIVENYTQTETNTVYRVEVYSDNGELVYKADCLYGEAYFSDELNKWNHQLDFLMELDDVAYYRLSKD